jgi:hypothetical protein
MSVQTRKKIYDFRGQHLVPVAASGVGSEWVKADTSSAGSPTVQGVSGGGLALTLAATSEVENICLYMGDVLPYDIDDLVRVEFIAKCTASLDASIIATFGLGSARADDTDSIATNAMFKLAGSNSVVCETDDGTTDKDDIATGDTLSTTFKRFAIDFSEGCLTQSAPSLSLPGKADVRFYMGNANGSLRRVGAGTQFNMNAATGNLQLFAQLQKTSGTPVATLTILEASVEYRLPV